MIILYLFLGWLGAGLFASYWLWDHYVIVMGLKRVKEAGKLTRAMEVFGWPRAITGIVLDVYVNFFFCPVVFLDMPEEWTVSGRLTRYFNEGDGWRHKAACWLLSDLLDAFDPSGLHRATL